MARALRSRLHHVTAVAGSCRVSEVQVDEQEQRCSFGTALGIVSVDSDVPSVGSSSIPERRVSRPSHAKLNVG